MPCDNDYLVKGKNKNGESEFYAVSGENLKDYRQGNFDYSSLEKLRKGNQINILLGDKPVIQKDGKIIFSAETVVDATVK